MNNLSRLWTYMQRSLFPTLEKELDPLTNKEKQFIEVVSLMDLPSHMWEYEWRGMGRMRSARLAVAKAFVAKSVFNFPTTEMLIEQVRGNNNLRRLCGWSARCDVPSPSTFSRAFSEFADKELTARILEAMIKEQCGSKIAGHVSRDSTPIAGREKPVRKKPAEKPAKRKRGRPRKGTAIEPKPPKRLDVQHKRSLMENLIDLPAECDKGTKKDSKGYKKSWNGYKLHLDCIDGDIPASAVLTSASLHDSQVAIPLAQMTADRVTSLYDLMDAAYDSKRIKDFSVSLGHVPIIDHNPRRGEKIKMDPPTKRRYAERSSAERVNSYLKDNYGGRTVRVRGAAKVMTHLMFGVLVIAATQIFRLLV